MTISNNASALRPGVCTSSTRPTTPYEGQMIYLTDTDLLQIWNGTSWRTLAFGTPSNGAVLQVQSTTLTTIWSASVASGASSDITGLSTTITPTSTSSKVLITGTVNGLIDVSGSYRPYFAVQLKRGSTLIGGGTTAGSRVSVIAGGGYSQVNDQNTNISFTYLDSPSTTSSITYQVVAFNPFGGTYTLRVNQQQSDSDTTTTMRFSSTITAQEIAA